MYSVFRAVRASRCHSLSANAGDVNNRCWNVTKLSPGLVYESRTRTYDLKPD